jgi:hypothetical protein
VTWLERYGAEIVARRLSYADVMDPLVSEGRYTTATLGHWLRTNVCLVEKGDMHVLYTDVDVLFSREPSIACVKPDFFSASLEFERDS